LDACRAQDPGAKKFVREVDTAERLDLVVLDNVPPQPDFNTALPAKFDVESKIEYLISQYKQKKISFKKTISAKAVPFVPGLNARANPAKAAPFVPGLNARAISAKATPFVPGLNARAKAFNPRSVEEVPEKVLEKTTENDSKTVEDSQSADTEAGVIGIEQYIRDHQVQKDESQQNDHVMAKELAPNERTHSQDSEDDNSESDEQFFDTQINASTSEVKANSEKSKSSASTLELGSSDDWAYWLIMFWGLEANKVGTKFGRIRF
jgi:hypothetical protein